MFKYFVFLLITQLKALRLTFHTVSSSYSDNAGTRLHSQKENNEIHDATAITILENLRNAFIKKNIVGSVEIGLNYNFGAQKSTSLSCDITEEHFLTTDIQDIPEGPNKLSPIEEAAIQASIRSVIPAGLLGIKRLQQRAKKYKNKSYLKDLILSESATLSIPLIDVYARLSASADALLNSNSD